MTPSNHSCDPRTDQFSGATAPSLDTNSNYKLLNVWREESLSGKMRKYGNISGPL